jgi:tRNA-modifying protein YgfZ
MTSLRSQAEQFAALLRGEATISTVRDVIVAVGPDTEKFLQGQLSQDVAKIELGTSKYTLHLQPNGRVIALARLTRVDAETIIIDTEQGRGEPMHTALSRFLIRTKCTLTLTLEVPTILSPGGPATTFHPHAKSIFPLTLSPLPFYAGIDIVGHLPDVPSSNSARETVDATVAEAFRVAVGIPRAGVELLESTIPSETGLTDAAVTFGKGCYVGQELVERIDSRGRTVRSIRRLVSAQLGDEVLAIWAKPALPVDLVSLGDTVGHLTSVAVHPVERSLVALGLVRAHIDVGTEITATMNGSNVVFRLVS